MISYGHFRFFDFIRLFRGERGDDDTPLPTETPTISPITPTIHYTSPFIFTDSSDSDSSKKPSSRDPFEADVARWRSRVASRPSSLETSLPLTPTNTTPPVYHILFASAIARRRRAILVSPGQPIPFGRPYRTHPNGLRDLSDHSSSDPSSDTSSYSHSVTSSEFSSGHSSSRHSSPTRSVTERPSHSSSAGPSRKRCRSPTDSLPSATPALGALTSVRADLLPPRKRIRGSIDAPILDDDVEDSYEPYTKPDIDSNIQVDIDACIAAADAIAARETSVKVEIVGDDEAGDEAESSARGTIEIRVDPRVEPVVADDIPELVREDFPDLVSADGYLEVMERTGCGHAGVI
ncbi:hypothetical protein Tco_0742509 [Tanacetum coccineum]